MLYFRLLANCLKMKHETCERFDGLLTSHCINCGMALFILDCNIPMLSVWYRLVIKSMAPYEDTTADLIILPDYCKVVELRELHKQKCANSLRHIDANQLAVYSNEQSIEQRDAFRPSCVIDITKHGLSEDNALLVVVPTSKATPPANKDLKPRIPG